MHRLANYLKRTMPSGNVLEETQTQTYHYHSQSSMQRRNRFNSKFPFSKWNIIECVSSFLCLCRFVIANLCIWHMSHLALGVRTPIGSPSSRLYSAYFPLLLSISYPFWLFNSILEKNKMLYFHHPKWFHSHEHVRSERKTVPFGTLWNSSLSEWWGFRKFYVWKMYLTQF